LLSAAASATQPQQLYFEGDVVMDVAEYTFSNDSELFFASGSELRIASGNLLNIEFSHLQGCEEMWKGIALEQGSELYFIVNKIEDAQYAIEALGDCQVSIFGNIFANNYVGIYKAPSVGFFEFNQPFPMAANQFSMEGALLPPYPGQLPGPGETGLAGIEVHDTKFLEVGSYSFLGINEFSGLRNGIIADNATVSVINGNFDNIVGDFNPTNLMNLPEEGVGILATEGAFVDARDCEFKNMVRAIHTVDNRGIIVRDCIIEHVEDGVICLGGTFMFRYDISDNEITDFRQFGICLAELIGVARRTTIRDNIITSDATVPSQYNIMSGIHLAVGADNNAAKIIQGNKITLNDSGYGIAVDNATSLQILDNEVRHQGTADFNALRPSDGIVVRESENALLKGNTLEYSQNGDPNIGVVSGFSIAQSLDASLCCNTTDGHTYGTELLGMMGNAEFRLTTIKDHSYGLRCGNGTAISTQEHAGNRWIGSYANAAALHEGSEENITFSIFQVQPPQATDLWPTHKGIESPAAPGQWFELFPGSAPDSCAADAECQSPPSEEMVFTPLDSLIRAGGFLGTDFGAALDWRGRQYLYDRMASNSGLHGISAAMDQFFAAESSGLIEQLDSVGRGVAAMGEIGAGLATTEEEALLLMNELRSIDSLFEAAATAADTAALQNTRQEILQDLNAKLDSLNAGYEQAQQELAVKASQLLSFNNSIAPGGNSFAANEQAVNEVALSLAASPDTPLSLSQEATLFSIAEQCLLEGGKAVITARALLLRDTSLAFAQYDDCSPVEERQSEPHAVAPSHSNRLSIAPNPGKANILVSWGAQPASKLEVYRINGERIAAFQLEEGSTALPISMSGHSNGLYLIRLLLQDGSTITAKLLVH
jgi:hypothetical protein